MGTLLDATAAELLEILPSNTLGLEPPLGWLRVSLI